MVARSVALVDLKLQDERVMDLKTCLVVNMEACSQLICQGRSEHIVPTSGLMCAMCSAGKVLWCTTPLVCLGTDVEESIAVKSLLEVGEGAWVTVEIPNYEHRPLWLHRHVAENALNKGVSPVCCFLVQIRIRPPI